VPTTERTGRRHCQQDSAVKPPAVHSVATAKNKNHQPHDPRQRRNPERDGNLRTSHLRRKPDHQVGTGHHPPPTLTTHKPSPKHSRQPPRRPPAPHLTTDLDHST
jgi:hypothetical protein